MKITVRIRSVIAALTCALFLTLTAHAGPPLICHPYDIGGAKSLPGGERDHFGLSAAYDRANLVNDTLALLTPDAPVLVRMETLRRAALYATNEMSAWRTTNGTYAPAERALALSLLQQLRTRTQTVTERDRPLALFDLGFYAETLRQTKLDPALDGYELLTKVAQIRPNDADVQFALALASVWPKRQDHTAHLQAALTGAKPGTLLAANLRTHFQR